MNPRHLRAVAGGPGEPTPPLESDELIEEGVLVDEKVVVSDAGLAAPVTRKELVPGWLRSRSAFAAAARWAFDEVRFVTTYHVIHAPWYAIQLARRAPAGAWRLFVVIAGWVADAEFRQSRDALVNSVSSNARGADALFRLSHQHRDTVRLRALTLLGLVVGLLVVGLWMAATLRWYEVAIATGAVVALLGTIGQPPDRPIIDRAVSSERYPRLTSEMITRALGSLSLGNMNSALRADDSGSAIQFVHPVARDGKGWRADVDLPIGVTAGQVIDKRESLASALRRPLSCVWPLVDPDAHEGRLILYVADKPLAASDKVAWPLADRGSTNVFEAIPIGVDQRGQTVAMTLIENSGLIGAVPGMGKTFLLRLLALGAGLDPRVETHAFNFKGGTDLDPLEAFAHAYRSGDEDDDMAYAIADLRDLATELRRRYKAIRRLPKDLIPESKITDHIASQPSLEFAPIVVHIDECHIAFEHPEHGPEFTAIVTDLIKRGRAVGIMIWLATQRPDKTSIPPGIRDNVAFRFAMKVTTQAANDMVLGTSMYKAGYRATQFGRKDYGIALFAGETADPVIVRTAFVDQPMATAIAARARAAKIARNFLTGYAAGADLEIDDTSASVLDHLAAIWPAGHASVWFQTLAERLADQYPATYHQWTGEQVSAAAKAAGIESIQIKRTGRNRRGIRLADLVDAQARLDANRRASETDDADLGASDGR